MAKAGRRGATPDPIRGANPFDVTNSVRDGLPRHHSRDSFALTFDKLAALCRLAPICAGGSDHGAARSDARGAQMARRPADRRGPAAGVGRFRAPAPAAALLRRPHRDVTVGKGVVEKAYRSRTLGAGRNLPDGTLALAQQIYDQGQPPAQRRWRIRQLAPGRFAGTMTEAVGPVLVDEVDGSYRFKFRMKGSLSVEQWLIPLPDGNSARTTLTVRKFGMRVASSVGTIRKL